MHIFISCTAVAQRSDKFCKHQTDSFICIKLYMKA